MADCLRNDSLSTGQKDAVEEPNPDELSGRMFSKSRSSCKHATPYPHYGQDSTQRQDTCLRHKREAAALVRNTWQTCAKKTRDLLLRSSVPLKAIDTIGSNLKTAACEPSLCSIEVLVDGT